MSPPAHAPGGRVDRYPLLPTVYKSVYPNPKPVTAYDPSIHAPTPPGASEISASSIAACQGKMENSDDPWAFESALVDFKRAVMKQKKPSFKAWGLFREMYGPAGTDYSTLNVRDPKMDRLSYDAAPSTYQKWGF